MTQVAESLFKEAIERYQAGEGADTLIPVFKEICERAPKNSNAWTCLAWLYLLDNKPAQAYKAAQKAVKLNPHDAQARVNLALAMLDSSQKGVRQQIETAAQLLLVSEELRQEVKKNIEDGLSRKADWKSLQRVKAWLFDV
ncbi:MAG: tetratricopeptide repeat protein [Oscillatoriaceae bacterium SKW80]|nr:tetratricopeptide repeat protein [Oscillatoriaceae bacterium SKYG93]MCX8121361.1 tetratricopeptide repeat protein [Oscillatoriaceae bacterium SKW80]MDW8451963.1 tetratricopeptide repeat protein [Oscillatoriaceae cyanobacterium SKYGB_i_bin93]HIK29504.1 tetratricopeptide repeat protein [Oscillatoriaceae cyanobacterium M7585_C2015_266]